MRVRTAKLFHLKSARAGALIVLACAISASVLLLATAAPSVSADRTAMTLGGSVVPVRLHCAGADCRGRASVSVARRVLRGGEQIGWRHLVVASAAIGLHAGAGDVVRLDETPQGKALLEAHAHTARRFRLTLTVELLGARPIYTPVFVKAR